MTTIRNGDRVTSLTGVRHLDVVPVDADEFVVIAVWPDGTEATLTPPGPRSRALALQNMLACRIGGR